MSGCWKSGAIENKMLIHNFMISLGTRANECESKKIDVYNG